MSDHETKCQPQCHKIYEHIKNEDGLVCKSSFLELLGKKGILYDDPRIDNLTRSSEEYGNLLGQEAFISCISDSKRVLESTLANSNIIPDFEAFVDDVKPIYDVCLSNTEGEVSNAVPHLPNHNEEHFGVSVCTVDGQRFNIGDTAVDFCLQSCSKPINYCLSLEEHGMEKVHKHVGREPSGIECNALILDSNGLPHNPLINSGGIMMCSLIRRDLNSADRLEYILSIWRKLTGGKPLGYSESVYQSERTTGHRNFALAYLLEENKICPSHANFVDVLENYFRCHSLTVKSNNLSIAAATLANGGVCPLTKEKVFSTDTVKNCLSTMYSCGMYSNSGEFAYNCGLPASSSGTGGIFVVIPNVMGICTYSPRLDAFGNSTRGVDFFSRLTQHFNFHLFEHPSNIEKINPGKEKDLGDVTVEKVIKYSSIGDLSALKRLRIPPEMLSKGDYDKRTPLHLAASNGHLNVVTYLLEQVGADNMNPVDRWGGTPYDDAIREQQDDVAQYLMYSGGRKGTDL